MSKSLADIRNLFLNYFGDNDHEILSSSSLVPVNDPTLLFTNAGMVQFKNVFVGQDSLPYQRATTSQKCVRAGGKHNDLDNVGYTARHHTFFEMLGNFSFGDYFKEEAIYYAWEFLTKFLMIDPNRLLVTVYAEDDEAFTLWKKIAGFSDEKIIRIATDDNFWSMGNTGPCGPCSEIFYDHGPEIAGGPPGSADEDGDRFIEIWNLVFMQFDQLADGTRCPLPQPSIDTGMGLERITALLQGKHNNYETDIFQNLISASVDISGQSATGKFLSSHRVIADHLRCCAFLIADGILPSNEGRGYVLRRIMRRAMRHAQLLGTKDPLLWRLVPYLKQEMSLAYPQLEQADMLICETLRHEEERFRETLSRGLTLLEDELSHVSGNMLSGDIAFKLYDTYGFPLDLTQDALRDRGLEVDIGGFERAMEKQRATARANWSGSGDAAEEKIWFDLAAQDTPHEFVGYQSDSADAEITALIIDGNSCSKAEKGQEVMLLASQTPFYAESGGQAGDSGIITQGENVMRVVTTQKRVGHLFIHQGIIEQGSFSVADVIHLQIDTDRRQAIRANHSATHLLHEALRRVLGEHVTQKGSLVEADYLRFDFSHSKAVTAEDLSKAEQIVNEMIRQNQSVTTRLMAPKEAVEAGALALFGEKYGDEVRVLSMGRDEDKKARGSYYSVELCGGTHVERLGEIGLLKIIQEGAVASGVRRIEAKTADAARLFMQSQANIAQDSAQILKSSIDDVPKRIQSLLEERKKLEHELSEAKKKLAMGGSEGSESFSDSVQEISGIKFFGKVLQDIPAKSLRGLVDDAKKQIESGVVCLIAIDEGKAGICVGVSDDLTDRFDAVELVRLGAEQLGGKGGGGRKDMAQAGGSDISNPQEALDTVFKGLG